MLTTDGWATEQMTARLAAVLDIHCPTCEQPLERETASCAACGARAEDESEAVDVRESSARAATDGFPKNARKIGEALDALERGASTSNQVLAVVGPILGAARRGEQVLASITPEDLADMSGEERAAVQLTQTSLIAIIDQLEAFRDAVAAGDVRHARTCFWPLAEELRDLDAIGDALAA
jgi:uncharacterized Zn finger protein (UPF0148 family)